MATKEENTKKECQCGSGCDCDQNKIMIGFKYGLGFWSAGLAIWIIISIIVAILYYFL
jgi:hypothetical protein